MTAEPRNGVREIHRESLPLDAIVGARAGTMLRREVLHDEIHGVRTELVSLAGPATLREPPDAACVVLLCLDGAATVRSANAAFEMCRESIVRLPHASESVVAVGAGATACLLRISLSLGPADIAAIAANQAAHCTLIGRRFADCTPYTEPIKSAKAVNRMLLLEGEVPRFGAGTVETTGPDEVAAHEHPMLEQLFLGLRGCRCTVHADGASAVLDEDSLLHVPLGSRHWVTVDAGQRLRYAWLDFFQSIEDQSYLTSAHKLCKPGETE